MKKKCKVVALTTEKDNYALVKGDFGWGVKTPGIDPDLYGSTRHHLYLISDDEIKVGDYYCNTEMRTSEYGVIKCETERLETLLAEKPEGYYKIIASTDPTLNLPLIPEEFVKSYCENPVSEVLAEIFVIKGTMIDPNDGHYYGFPKLYCGTNPSYPDVRVFLVENGYPMDNYINHREWRVDVPRVKISPVETSWNKEQLEFWLMQNVVDYLNLAVLDFNEISKSLLPTLDDLGQRFKEFQEDQRADTYKRDFEDREYYNSH